MQKPAREQGRNTQLGAEEDIDWESRLRSKEPKTLVAGIALADAQAFAKSEPACEQVRNTQPVAFELQTTPLISDDHRRGSATTALTGIGRTPAVAAINHRSIRFACR